MPRGWGGAGGAAGGAEGVGRRLGDVGRGFLRKSEKRLSISPGRMARFQLLDLQRNTTAA